MLAFSSLAAEKGDVPWVEAIFYGLRAAVVGIVLAALIRIARRSIRNGAAGAIALLAFAGIFILHVPFPAIVLGAGIAGLALGGLRPGALRPPVGPVVAGGGGEAF